MSDPTAQMGYQVGKTAMMAGQEYMEQNVRSIRVSMLSSVSSFAFIDLTADSSTVMFRYQRSNTTSMSQTLTS